jgi:asparagine synthase (glutamine-hydrolysing)
MCGIAGFVETTNNGSHVCKPSHVLEQMCQVIAHRGPDDQGTLAARGAAWLGMRRLAIIDLAGGQQPIANETGTMHIVFNGEIYNYPELRSGLLTRGHEFQTHSDTETILHLYEERSARCVDDLRGMFAFAIWDERKRELFIARDRVGKKPLYYTVTQKGTLVFGSELKSLLAHPEVEARTNPRAVDAYLSFGYVPDPFSIFEGIHKLPPGSHLTFRDGRVEIKQYWDFTYGATDETHATGDSTHFDEEACLVELRRLLDEAVRVRLISEVPLGAFLSGGVDSSTIVGLMARHAKRTGAPKVKTFSIGFNEDTYDELKYARVAAKHFDTDHHEFVVTPDACEIAGTIVRHFDEPFSDSSAIPTYIVSKLAREHVTVALSGDGGDELFGGYTRYVTEHNRSGFSRLPGAMRRGVLHPLSRRLPHGARGRNYLYNIALDGVDRYADNVSLFSQLSRDALYTDDFQTQLRAVGATSITTLFRELAARVHTGEALDELLYIDSKTYLPGDILTKVDRMSMAVSLETRAPLLDHKLIEFVGRIPARLKMKGTETKHILKRAVEDLVPGEILHRPKQGFGIPLDEWINRQLRDQIHETLTSPRMNERGLLKPAYVATLLDEHERGRRDHSTQLWSLFMLELWHREYVDQPASRAQPDKLDLAAVGV